MVLCADSYCFFTFSCAKQAKAEKYVDYEMNAKLLHGFLSCSNLTVYGLHFPIVFKGGPVLTAKSTEARH